jgi:ketosteroid isomerase-like protein
LAYRANDAINRRDLDALLALIDPSVEFTSLIVNLEGGGAYHGHNGIRTWWEAVFGVFPDYSSEIEEVRELGDMTVMRARQRGRGLESDAPTVQTRWFVTEWRNGKAIWAGVFRNEAEALEAAGLSE